MKTILTIIALAVTAFAAPHVHAQQATGGIDQHANQCDPQTAAANTTDCSDTINVSIQVASASIGRPGAIFVAVLPLGPDGNPVSFQGGYATETGWKVSPEPSAYATGRLPATWDRSLTVPGGICNAARANGASGVVTLGVYAGYGLIPPTPGAQQVPSAQAQQIIANADATGDPKVAAMAREILGGATSPRLQGLLAAAQMQKDGTIWKITEITCHG